MVVRLESVYLLLWRPLCQRRWLLANTWQLSQCLIDWHNMYLQCSSVLFCMWVVCQQLCGSHKRSELFVLHVFFMCVVSFQINKPWEHRARTMGKVIAWAIVSAIYTCCDCNFQIVWESMWFHINHILQVFEHCTEQNKRVSHASNGQADWYRFASHKAHDSRGTNWYLDT